MIYILPCKKPWEEDEIASYKLREKYLQMMYLTKNFYLDDIKNYQTQQKNNKKFKNPIIK